MAELATQSFLEIKDIKEGVVTLKDNSIRGIMLVSSISFALKSEEEQTAIIYAFQNFLNSLDFFCQILIQSRNINITPYLDSLKALENKQTNELLRKQTTAYREFIKKMVVGDMIMTKSFYIIVPYNLAEIFGAQGIAKQFDVFKKKPSANSNKQTEEDFQRAKTQLWQRMEYVAMGLKRCGLEAMPLTTVELIELFWATHHPDQAEVGYYPEILPELLK